MKTKLIYDLCVEHKSLSNKRSLISKLLDKNAITNEEAAVALSRIQYRSNEIVKEIANLTGLQDQQNPFEEDIFELIDSF